MKYQLSISILVSNHIDTIRKCLESIKPLLTDLRTELIIVDTGSTDGSIEVAKEYTDKIIPFTWCDDFSAARNAGLKAAYGEWFMYLDDDEWFEDVSEIVHFFQKEKYMEYGRAFYIVRNYKDFSGTNYSDTYVLRMFQIVENIHFKHRIHEFVSPELDPLKIFTSYVHHYGYIGTTSEKSRRNIPLLELELQENPKDIRMLAQLINEFCLIQEYTKVLDLKDNLDSIKRGAVNDALYCYAQAKMAESYCQLGQLQDAIQYANDLLQNGIYNSVTEAYLYIILIYVYLDDKYQDSCRNQMALQSFRQYMRCVRECSVSKEEFSKLDIFGLGNIFQKDYTEKVIRILAQSLREQNEYEEFLKILRYYNINPPGKNVTTASQEIQEIKTRFFSAIQTLLDAGQLEAALQAVNQAITILGNDNDLHAIKTLIEEESRKGT